jgi:hypothetical protein
MSSLIEEISEDSEKVHTTPRLIVDNRVYEDLSRKLKSFLKLKNHKRGLVVDHQVLESKFPVLYLDSKKLENEEVKEFLKLYPKAAQPQSNTFNAIPRFFNHVKFFD